MGCRLENPLPVVFSTVRKAGDKAVVRSAPVGLPLRGLHMLRMVEGAPRPQLAEEKSHSAFDTVLLCQQYFGHRFLARLGSVINTTVVILTEC